jgi:hypothetical protein
MSSTNGRAAAIFVIASVGLAAAMFGASMWLYPGGTWCDRAAPGHSFFGNFLCDLTWKTSLAGRPNPIGSVVGSLAMLVLAAGLFAFFFVVARQLGRRPRLQTSVRVLGAVAIVGSIGVTLMPSETFGDRHGQLVMLAGAAGLIACLLATIGLLRPAPPLALAGAVTIVATVIDLSLYAWHYFHRVDCGRWTPAVQKVALALLLSWMVLVARRALVPASLER